jgi:hypothetical protein
VTILRLLLLSRQVPLVLATVAFLAVLAWVFDTYAVTFEISIINPAHKAPYPELLSLVGSILLAALLRPRFWEWERLGNLRTRISAGLTAVVGILLSLVPVLVGSLRLPQGMPWGWSVANALTLSGAVFSLSTVVGAAIAGGVVLVGYFAYAVMDNVWIGADPYLPLVAYPGPHGLWWLAVVLCLVAILMWFRTRGASVWAHRLRRNE